MRVLLNFFFLMIKIAYRHTVNVGLMGSSVVPCLQGSCLLYLFGEMVDHLKTHLNPFKLWYPQNLTYYL